MHNIRMQVDTNCEGDTENDPLSQIIINPALQAQNRSKGVCGYWYKNNVYDIIDEINPNNATNNNSITNTLENFIIDNS